MMNDIVCCNCDKHLGRISFNWAIDNYKPTTVIKKIKYKSDYVCTLLCDECAKEEQQNTINLDDIPKPE